jgi:predicted transcriptional regulator
VSYKPDDVCRDIIIALRSGGKDYAEIMRHADIGSYETVKDHIKHLENEELVRDKKEKKGRKTYHDVSLTKKGTDLVTQLRGQERG